MTDQDVARLRKEKDEIVDGVKHAISEILEHFDDNDEFARSLRNHLMGTITDKHGEAYQTELDAAINTIGQLQHRNGHLQEAAEIWERNSEDACQLWELLRQVDQEAGNSAAPARRHSLTPMLRDDIEKILREKPKPEDRITAIREERDRLKEAVKVLREGLGKSLRHTDVVDNAVVAWGCCGEGKSCGRCEKAQANLNEITEARRAMEQADAILAGKEGEQNDV